MMVRKESKTIFQPGGVARAALSLTPPSLQPHDANASPYARALIGFRGVRGLLAGGMNRRQLGGVCHVWGVGGAPAGQRPFVAAPC